MAEMSYYVTLVLFGVVMALSFREMAFSTDSHDTKPSKDIPKPNFSRFAGPTVKFLFCYS
jgi:hypothetical protein